MAAKTDQFLAVGRRKTSVARVVIRPGTGRFTVNGRSLEEFFPGWRNVTPRIPLEKVGALNKYDVIANVKGGGITGQAEAIRHGVARALVQVDAEMKPALKAGGLLTRDPRMVERKKYGRKKARKRFQFSKR